MDSANGQKKQNNFFVGRMKSPLWAIMASILVFAVILYILVRCGAQEQVLLLLRWFEAQEVWAPLLFILIMALVVVLLLPGVFFTTGAGFVFGVVEGSVIVVLGTTLGAALSFLMARHLFGKRAAQFILARSKTRLISEELTPHGWKIILLTRLIPFFPSKISNYFFGLTAFSFRDYLIGSLIGFIPFSVHNVYLGSIAADLSTLGQHHASRTPLMWVLYGLGFVATVFFVVYVTRLARRALNRYLQESGEDERL